MKIKDREEFEDTQAMARIAVERTNNSIPAEAFWKAAMQALISAYGLSKWQEHHSNLSPVWLSLLASLSQWQFPNQGIRSDKMSNWNNEHILQWYRRRIKAIIKSYEV